MPFTAQLKPFSQNEYAFVFKAQMKLNKLRGSRKVEVSGHLKMPYSFPS